MGPNVSQSIWSFKLNKLSLAGLNEGMMPKENRGRAIKTIKDSTEIRLDIRIR